MKTLYAPVAVIVLLVAAVIVYISTFVVTERDQAILLRFGVIERVITEPGLYFKWPTNVVDQVQIIDKRLNTVELAGKVVQVNDGRRYVVDSFATFRIVDARRFRESVSANLDLATDRLTTRLEAALRQVYGQRSFEAALSSSRDEMMTEVKELVAPEATKIGIDLVDVRIRRTDLVPEVSQQTYERMRAERLAEAAQLRAQGTEQSLTIRANADRQATVLVAEARRDADILHGEGDAEKARVLAAAFGKDPDFFVFYRSMQAYRDALTKGTSMVLEPGGDFFRFFGNGAGVADKAAGKAAAN